MLVHFSTTHFLPYPIADIHMNLLYLKNEGEFRKWLCSLEWLDCSEGQLAPSCFHKIEFPQTTCSLSVFPNNNNNKKGRKLDWGKKKQQKQVGRDSSGNRSYFHYVFALVEFLSSRPRSSGDNFFI